MHISSVIEKPSRTLSWHDRMDLKVKGYPIADRWQEELCSFVLLVGLRKLLMLFRWASDSSKTSVSFPCLKMGNSWISITHHKKCFIYFQNDMWQLTYVLRFRVVNTTFQWNRFFFFLDYFWPGNIYQNSLAPPYLLKQLSVICFVSEVLVFFWRPFT